jgi:hypothetical protein
MREPVIEVIGIPDDADMVTCGTGEFIPECVICGMDLRVGRLRRPGRWLMVCEDEDCTARYTLEIHDNPARWEFRLIGEVPLHLRPFPEWTPGRVYEDEPTEDAMFWSSED